EIPLPATFTPNSQVIRSLVNPRDDSVWMTNYFAGEELVRFDPHTFVPGTDSGFLHVPLPRPPGKFLPDGSTFPPFPVDMKLTSTGDLVFNTQFGNSIGYISRAAMFNPSACTQLESDVVGAQCEWGLNPTPPIIQGPDASCTNPCITETL